MMHLVHHAHRGAVVLWLCLYIAPGTNAQVIGAASDSLDLKVMTFNIRYGTADDGEDRWEARKEMLFTLIREQSPDILGVQEALRFQLDEIRAAIPGYDVVGAGRDDGKTKGEYSAILYRSARFQRMDDETFWFSDTPDVPGSMTWGNTFPRICTWTGLMDNRSGKSLYVYNLHLDHISQPSREKSVIALAAKIRQRDNEDPVIVMGDFNAGERNPAILFLKGEKSPIRFVDTFRSLHPADSTVGTFHAFHGDRNGEKIDYIFVELRTVIRDAAILYANTGGRYPSDHFPVTARIRVP